MVISAKNKVLGLATKMGIVRPRDLQKKGLPPDYLWRLHQKDKLVKVGRGMYAIPGVNLAEHQTLSRQLSAYHMASSV